MNCVYLALQGHFLQQVQPHAAIARQVRIHQSVQVAAHNVILVRTNLPQGSPVVSLARRATRHAMAAYA